MLKDQPWIHLAPHMREEYEQCLLEGLPVESFKDRILEVIQSRDEAAARALCDEMHTMAPKGPKDGYPFVEPSDYASIVRESPCVKADKKRPADPEMLKKLEGAWLGRIAGCLLGKPTEGWLRDFVYPLLKATDNYPMHKYIQKRDFPDEYRKMEEDVRHFMHARCYADLCCGVSPADDDTSYTVLGMKIVECYGKHFSSDDVLEAWLSWVPFLNVCTAERVAYQNASAGLLAPETATHYNPYREWIGAQIRADFFGYVNPGSPARAAEMAYRDAAISHTKNGIYGEMFAAACIAAAATAETVEEIIEAGLDVIPGACRLRRDIELVRQWHREGIPFEGIVDRIHEAYPPTAPAGWVYTNPNTMIVTAALLYGEGLFGKSICLAVQACYDTDCNGATVGSVMGMFLGKDGVGSEWIEPFQGKCWTNISGYYLIDAKDMAQKTLKLINDGQ